MIIKQEHSICALATPIGVAGIAVIRVSGKDTFSIVDTLFRSSTSVSSSDTHRVLVGKWMYDGVFVDEVTVSVFRSPKSYTGEDVCEIGCHGGHLVSRSILDSLLAAGCRTAEPGEFTRRAFVNGKIDLTKAESIADIIHNNSPRSISVSKKQYNQAFRKEVSVIRAALIKLAGLLELGMDFSEEGIEFVSFNEIQEQLHSVLKFTTELLNTKESARILRNGITVSLYGRPNAGKSSILNALVQKERAIVSNVAGTTRDYIEDSILVEGVKVTIVDTAGIRISADDIENKGVQNAKQQVLESDIVCLVHDSSDSEASLRDMASEVQLVLEPNQVLLIVLSKSDLIEEANSIIVNGIDSTNVVHVSTEDETGVRQLVSWISDFIERNTSSETSVLLNDRIIGELSSVRDILSELTISDSTIDPEFLSIDIRQCIKHLNYITGDEWSEDILDTVFSNFCIGK